MVGLVRVLLALMGYPPFPGLRLSVRSRDSVLWVQRFSVVMFYCVGVHRSKMTAQGARLMPPMRRDLNRVGVARDRVTKVVTGRVTGGHRATGDVDDDVRSRGELGDEAGEIRR